MFNKPIKTKKEFMSKLKSALLWNYNKDEIIEVINDYEEFFAVGLEKGEEEEKLCKDFGNPKDIAMNLDVELKNKGKGRWPLKIIIRLMTAIVLTYFTLGFVFLTIAQRNSIQGSIIGLILFLAVLWFLLGGGIYSTPPIKKQESIKNKKFLIGSHIITFILTSIVFLFTDKVVWRWILNVSFPFNMEPGDIGPFIDKIMLLFTSMALILFLYGLIGFYYSSSNYYTVICHSTGSLYAILCIRNMFNTLADIKNYHSIVMYNLLPYLSGIILTLFFAGFIYFLGKRGVSYGCSNEKRVS